MATQEQQLMITPQDERMALTPSAPTPMTLIQMAVAQGADVDKLEKLMELKLRWDAHEAKQAFVKAMNDFKANPPQLFKNKHVQFGNTQYDHATLDNVVDTIVAGLSKHGLSHSWKVEQNDGHIKVTCVITHELGHSECVSMVSGADTSGSKNPIQAIASAVTYLQRYTLLSATGMAAKGMDNDGQGDSGLDQQCVEDWLTALNDSSDLDELQRNFKDAYKSATEAKDKQAQNLFIKAKDARKKVLQCK